MIKIFFIFIVSVLIFSCSEDKQKTKDVCENVVCLNNGICKNISGNAVCECVLGYKGDDCSECNENYQDNDNNGTCLLKCENANLNCAVTSQCIDLSGEAKCLCNVGYKGDDCSECDENYQDNDDNETCLLNCENANLTCSETSQCSDLSGEAKCVCKEGYTGNSCSECDENYQDNDNNNTCLLKCIYSNLSCNINEICSDLSGEATCVCKTGYVNVNNVCVPQVQKVSSGGKHTCVIYGGYLYCSGDNNRGQLGLNDLAPRNVFTKVNDLSDWTDVSCGYEHTCGINKGKLFCWGWNYYGQTGIGHSGDGASVAIKTPQLVGEFSDWQKINSGHIHTCALRNNDFYCFGGNLQGQLGLGTSGEGTNVNIPTYLTTIPNLMSFSTKGYHTCRVQEGQLYCFGGNISGQLGFGDYTTRTTAQRVGTDVDWLFIENGKIHTCGIKSAGLYCFGDNINQQIGINSVQTEFTTPQLVDNGNWTYIGGGEKHTCGIKGGFVYCFGNNQFGQLGNSSYDNKNIPTLVENYSNWTQLSVGYNHVCGIINSELYCFGNNSNGELGTGLNENKNTPIKITINE